MSAAKQFMDCIEPMPVVEKLDDSCWGASVVGKRDQGNGLEDRTMAAYSYWDGAVIKNGDDGKYYLFASRWDQAGGHWGNNKGSGWLGSQAVVSVSDSLYGPYTDLGPLWPDWCEGAGHNVFPFFISRNDPLYSSGYRYAICVTDVVRQAERANGTIHIAKKIRGPWELLDNGNGGRLKRDEKYALSNVSITVSPEGKYVAVNRHGDIMTSDSLAGDWEVRLWSLWTTIPSLDGRVGYIEDGVIWYGNGRFNIVVNDWEARQAYYFTSSDALSWKLRDGLAYTPKADFIRYTDGTVNRWTKMERPNVYIEDGKVRAMTFAAIDVQKENDLGDDDHGSKIIVVPFSSEKLDEFLG